MALTQSIWAIPNQCDPKLSRMACCPAREQFVTLMSPEAMHVRQALPNSYIAAVCIVLAGFAPEDIGQPELAS
jgi:hypothetical protein